MTIQTEPLLAAKVAAEYNGGVTGWGYDVGPSLRPPQTSGKHPRRVWRPTRLTATCRTIGLLSSLPQVSVTAPFQAHLLDGLQHGCQQHGYDLLLVNRARYESAAALVELLSSGQLAALVCYLRPGDPLASSLAAAPLPVMTLAGALPGVPCVTVDNARGGRLQAQHLWERGHRQVLYITSPIPLYAALVRQAAFLAEAERRGQRVTLVQAAPDPAHLDEATLDWLLRDAPGQPTALVGWSDGTARLLLAQLIAHGVTAIPEQLAVVGFDGLPVHPALTLPSPWTLTSIAAPWHAVGVHCIDLLAGAIAGQPLPNLTELPVKLLVGNTT
ncbi:MAG: LacI family DNA-binding transcriptional regulator [Fimbriimonadaceae bacterium]|nr:LacI family DNA-binding transcriptional regulator [Fimbriimonadaceae bacterium]